MKWFWENRPGMDDRQRLDAAAKHAGLLNDELTRRQDRIVKLEAETCRLQELLEEKPWAPRKGVSKGAYHSDPGTDISWASLDERAEQEASAFRNHPGYKAVLDILEARLLGIFRRWRSTDDAAEIATLHIHARVYEDMLAVLEAKTSLKDRKEANARREEKIRQESDRLPSLTASGRSPFLR